MYLIYTLLCIIQYRIHPCPPRTTQCCYNAASPQKSPVVAVKVREEPAVIKEWREKQMELLRKKDEEEENARNRLRDEAAKELSDWYAQNTIQVEKLRETNRQAMDNTDKTFVAQMEPIKPGTEWDRYYSIIFTYRDQIPKVEGCCILEWNL